MPNRYGLSLRAASALDAEGLSELLKASGLVFDHHGLAKRLDVIGAEFGVVLLAEEWGPPSGVILVHWSWTLMAEARVAYVTTLVVDPEQRRRGIARLLLKAASQAARSAGCGELRLMSPEGAADLREFCRSTGFVDSGGLFARPLRKQS